MSRRNCRGSEVSRLFLNPVCVLTQDRHFGTGAGLSRTTFLLPNCLFGNGDEASRVGPKCLVAEVSDNHF